MKYSIWRRFIAGNGNAGCARKRRAALSVSSVPYWIVLVALVLYGLSAPYHRGVFGKLTPGWGFIAPIGVEFGLLYAAFRRRHAKSENEALPWTLWALEVLLFLTAMLVNGVGSFTSAVEAVQLENLSFAAIIEGFGNLPATSQAALMMALLAAFIIPIGALVAGDGLAALALDWHAGSDFRERCWQEVEFTVICRAVFVRYLQQGIGQRDARQRSISEDRSEQEVARFSMALRIPRTRVAQIIREHYRAKTCSLDLDCL